MPEPNEDIITEEPQDTGKEDEKLVKLTQDALNSMNAEARRKGQEQGKTQALQALGLEDFDGSIEEVSTLVKSALEAKEQSKTELEKRDTKIAKLETDLQAANASADTALKAARNILMQAAVREAAVTTKDFEITAEALPDIWLFISGDEELSKLVTIDENNKVEGASAAIAKLIEKRPYIGKKVAKSGPGTGGRQSNTNDKATDPTPAPSVPDKPLVKF